MLDCISGGRIISGFVRGTAVEMLHAGISPTENRERFEEAHYLILKCWTTPGPFRWEGRYFPHRMVNPWVLPMQKPLNSGYILIYGNEGPMPHEDTMRSIELFGTKVIPALKNDD